MFVLLAGGTLFAGGEPQKTTRSDLLLGTAVTVTTYGRVSESTFDEVFARVLEIEEHMSTSEEKYSDTEVMRVNAGAGGQAVAVSADTFEVVSHALRYSAVSGGAFDVSIFPLVRLWGIGTESAAVPRETEIAGALELVDYTEVEILAGEQTIRLGRTGMGIDVGGIAKGYAADEAAAILVEAGVESALLDFGGNILTVGRKPDGSSWRIGIQVPDAQRGEFLGIATVADQSVVTSGTYERFFEEDGVRYHHILDPKTGHPYWNGLDSVSIITSLSIDADALSTTVFALGLDAGMEFVEQQPDVEAIFVTTENQVHLSSGASEVFELTNEKYRLATR